MKLIAHMPKIPSFMLLIINYKKRAAVVFISTKKIFLQCFVNLGASCYLCIRAEEVYACLFAKEVEHISAHHNILGMPRKNNN